MEELIEYIAERLNCTEEDIWQRIELNKEDLEYTVAAYEKDRIIKNALEDAYPTLVREYENGALERDYEGYGNNIKGPFSDAGIRDFLKDLVENNIKWQIQIIWYFMSHTDEDLKIDLNLHDKQSDSYFRRFITSLQKKYKTFEQFKDRVLDCVDNSDLELVKFSKMYSINYRFLELIKKYSVRYRFGYFRNVLKKIECKSTFDLKTRRVNTKYYFKG